MSTLIGKCVQINEYKINVLSHLDVGRTGRSFKVAVLEPKSQSGVRMALQFCQGQGLESRVKVARAAKIFMKMDENEPVPHTVSMRALGPLRVPRRPLLGCGCINLPP